MGEERSRAGDEKIRTNCVRVEEGWGGGVQNINKKKKKKSAARRPPKFFPALRPPLLLD